MDTSKKQAESALQAAQMYYYQNLPMKKIAVELGVSASTVSRLLTWAREHGMVEIRINDLHGRANSLEELIKLRYKIQSVTVVPVPEVAGQVAWQDRVARVASNYLNQVMKSNMVLGVAWGGGQLMDLVAGHLVPKRMVNAQIVQLNGGDAIPSDRVSSAIELTIQFAKNYDGTPHLFHVPTYFDTVATKESVWQERSIQRVLSWHRQLDIALFSLGTETLMANPETYSQPQDYDAIENSGAVGNIANVLLDEDGRFSELAINQRACSLDLNLLTHVDRSICVVSGGDKLPILCAALAGGYITDLILDEPTARQLAELL